MKYLFMITILTSNISMLFPTFVANANEPPPSLHTIDRFEKDITGDELKERVKLQGNYLSNDSSFFQQATLNRVNRNPRNFMVF